MKRNKDQKKRRSPDVEIGAKARASHISFSETSGVEVEFIGEPASENESTSHRKNLPEKVRPGEEYGDIEIQWKAASWIEDSEEEKDEKKIKENKKKS